MPLPLAAALTLAQAGYQAYQGYQNKKEADRLAKEGPQDPTPLAFRQMQANQQNQANNAQVAGYGQIMDNMNEAQSSTLGEAKRAGTTSSNLLNVLTRLNQQRQKGVRDLGIQGAQAQEQRQNQLNSTLMARGGYQEMGRQENARAIGALTGASRQNYFNALTSGVGAAAPLVEGIQGMNQGAKANMLADKGYTEADFGGKTLGGISRSTINDLPNRFDTERTSTMDGMNSTPNFSPQYNSSQPDIDPISGYPGGFRTIENPYLKYYQNR